VKDLFNKNKFKMIGRKLSKKINLDFFAERYIEPEKSKRFRMITGLLTIFRFSDISALTDRATTRRSPT